jgi:hypothetical protein
MGEGERERERATDRDGGRIAAVMKMRKTVRGMDRWMDQSSNQNPV